MCVSFRYTLVTTTQHPVQLLLPLDRELNPLLLPIYMALKLLQLLLTMVPDNEDIISHPLPQYGLVLASLTVYELLLQPDQINASNRHRD